LNKDFPKYGVTVKVDNTWKHDLETELTQKYHYQIENSNQLAKVSKLKQMLQVKIDVSNLEI